MKTTIKYVSIEQAKLLKELGFHEKVKMYYQKSSVISSKKILGPFSFLGNSKSDANDDVCSSFGVPFYSCPELAHAKKWIKSLSKKINSFSKLKKEFK
jgi:hypothetical protein